MTDNPWVIDGLDRKFPYDPHCCSWPKGRRNNQRQRYWLTAKGWDAVSDR